MNETCASPVQGPRVVVSLSTVPDRVFHLFPALDSLLTYQSLPPSEVVLQFPRDVPAKRFSGKKWEVDHLPSQAKDWIAEGRLRVHWCEDDWGPATKLLGALTDPDVGDDDIIITVDDDISYNKDVISNLAKHATALPDAIVAHTGHSLRPGTNHDCHSFLRLARPWSPMRVHCVEGYWGVAYRKRFFQPVADLLGEHEDHPADSFFVDDDWISCCAARRGVARYVVPIPPGTDAGIATHDQGVMRTTALNSGDQLWKNIACQQRVLSKAVGEGVFAEEGVPPPVPPPDERPLLD